MGPSRTGARGTALAKAFHCLLLLAASILGTATAFAACMPVNGLSFEQEQDCNVGSAAVVAPPAAIAPPAAAAPVVAAPAIAAPARLDASTPPQENSERAPAAPASEAADRNPPSRLYRVQRNLSDGFLAMRSGPGGQYDTILRIPAGTEGLNVAECPKASDGSRSWCRVSWKGKNGWVFSRFIAQQN